MYALTIITGTFFFERAFDLASDQLFYAFNKGVSKIMNIEHNIIIYVS